MEPFPVVRLRARVYAYCALAIAVGIAAVATLYYEPGTGPFQHRPMRVLLAILGVYCIAQVGAVILSLIATRLHVVVALSPNRVLVWHKPVDWLFPSRRHKAVRHIDLREATFETWSTDVARAESSHPGRPHDATIHGSGVPQTSVGGPTGTTRWLRIRSGTRMITIRQHRWFLRPDYERRWAELQALLAADHSETGGH